MKLVVDRWNEVRDVLLGCFQCYLIEGRRDKFRWDGFAIGVPSYG